MRYSDILFIVYGAYQELKPTPAPREVAQQHISEPSKPNEEKKQEEKPFTEDEALQKKSPLYPARFPPIFSHHAS